MSEDTPKKNKIEALITTLKVQDIDASVAFYAKTLGFQRDWQYEKNGYSIAGISRDGLSLYLCESEEGSKEAWIWIGLDDAEFDSILASGAKIRQKPTNYRWAYEMRIEDPDGHVLRLGAGPRDDMPFEE